MPIYANDYNLKLSTGWRDEISFGSSPSIEEWSHTAPTTVFHDKEGPEITRWSAPPLTTHYKLPDSCTQRWWLYTIWPYTHNTDYSTMMIFDAPFGPDKEAENMADQYSCKPLEGNYVAYSPGVCPEGHWIAEMTQHQVVSTGTVVSRHWQGSCCPSGMKFGTEYPRRCIGSRPSDIDIFTIVLSDNDDRVGTWTREKHYTGGASAVVVPNIVAWQEEDMSLFPTPYASALAQRMGVEFPQSSASAAAPGSSIPELPLETNLPPPPQQTQNEGKRGLSPGAKAGVGIVVAAVVIGLVSVILFLRRRRRRRDFSPPEAHDQEDLPEFVASPGETKSFLGGIGNMSAIWRDREKGRHSVAGDGGAVQVQARWADDASQVLPPSSPVEMQAERDVSEMGGPKTPTTKLGPEGGR